MKRLTLLRHAKSTWDDPVARDFDRPLNRRGRKAARRVGEEMRALGLAFDAVVASPALRVRETLAEVEQGYGRSLAPTFEPAVYLAAPETLIEIVRGAEGTVASLLLAGHNPGIESLAMALGRGSPLVEQVAVKYPTGTLAELEFDVERWRDVEPGRGRLVRFVRPRDLDPELGPDEDT